MLQFWTHYKSRANKRSRYTAVDAERWLKVLGQILRVILKITRLRQWFCSFQAVVSLGSLKIGVYQKLNFQYFPVFRLFRRQNPIPNEHPFSITYAFQHFLTALKAWNVLNWKLILCKRCGEFHYVSGYDKFHKSRSKGSSSVWSYRVGFLKSQILGEQY